METKGYPFSLTSQRDEIDGEVTQLGSSNCEFQDQQLFTKRKLLLGSLLSLVILAFLSSLGPFNSTDFTSNTLHAVYDKNNDPIADSEAFYATDRPTSATTTLVQSFTESPTASLSVPKLEEETLSSEATQTNTKVNTKTDDAKKSEWLDSTSSKKSGTKNLPKKSQSELVIPKYGTKYKLVGFQQYGEWEISRLDHLESVKVFALYSKTKNQFRLKVEINIAQSFLECTKTKSGCIFRWYVKGSDEIAGGTYLVRKARNSNIYYGSVVLHELGTADATYEVEVIRLNHQPTLQTDKTKPPKKFHQQGYLITDPDNNEIPLWKAVKEIRTKNGKGKSTKLKGQAITSGAILSQPDAIEQKWGVAYHQLPYCKFHLAGTPAWKDASWTSLSVLVERGVSVEDTVGQRSAHYVWFPRDCRLVQPTQENVDSLWKPKSNTKGATGIFLLGTSRMRNVFESIPRIVKTTTSLAVDELVEDEEDKRHVSKYFEVQDNFHLSLVWGANRKWDPQQLLETFSSSSLGKFCHTYSKLKPKQRSNYKLLIGVSLGVWETRADRYASDDVLINYFNALFSNIRKNCGKAAHIFLVTQPGAHLYNPNGKIWNQKPGKELHIDMRHSPCRNCGTETDNIALLHSQDVAAKAARKYKVGFVDLYSMTAPLRSFSKDSLHYQRFVSTQLLKVTILGYMHAAKYGLH